MSFNFFGYLIFAFVTSITPGPNNLMLLSYGKAHGFNDSSRIMSGIALGFFVMLSLAGYGIARVIAASAVAELILKIAGSLWMLFLAFQLSRMTMDNTPGGKMTIGFTQAFFQQFVNSKAWIMAITGASAFMPKFENVHFNVFLFAVIFGAIGWPCMLAWIKMGDTIAKVFKSEKSHKRIGYTMFVLMLVSIAMIWLQ